jgi:hypothetical protein
MLIRPLGSDMYINVKPLSRGAFLAAPEHSIHVLLWTVETKRQSDPREDMFVIAIRIVEVLEQTGIWRNPEPTFVSTSGHHIFGVGSEGTQVGEINLT